MIGLEYPNPTGIFHFRTSPFEGKEERIPDSVQTPSRFGPRHCGQSVANVLACMNRIKKNPSMTFNRRNRKGIEKKISVHSAAIDYNRKPVFLLVSGVRQGRLVAYAGDTLRFVGDRIRTSPWVLKKM
jgi:hypothetical protein